MASSSRRPILTGPASARGWPLRLHLRRVCAWQTAALVALVCVAWIAFSLALLGRYAAYYSSAYDLGFFDQIIWNTAHGRWFQTSFLHYSFAGQHTEPVLLLFAAIYHFLPHLAKPQLLLLTQAAVVAWAAVPLYLAARRALASASAGLCVAAAYLLAPQLHGAVLFDFHPDVMGAAGIFAAFALLLAKRPYWALAAIAWVFLLKEDAAFVGAGFALIFWLRGYRRQAVGLFLASLLYAVLVIALLMPHVRGGAPSDLQERYGYLGTTLFGITAAALRHPGVVLAHLFGPSQRRALAYLFSTQAFLPLASVAVLAAAPELAINLLVTHPDQQSLTLHYVALSFYLVIVAAVLGIAALTSARWAAPIWRRLRVAPSRRGPLLAGILVLAETAGFLIGSPLGLRFQPSHYLPDAHTQAIETVLRHVPPGVSLSAQSGLLPHLAQREQVWEFPKLHDAAYVVVDRYGWRSSQSTGAGFSAVLAALPARGYCRIAARDGVELYERMSPCASR